MARDPLDETSVLLGKLSADSDYLKEEIKGLREDVSALKEERAHRKGVIAAIGAAGGLLGGILGKLTGLFGMFGHG